VIEAGATLTVPLRIKSSIEIPPIPAKNSLIGQSKAAKRRPYARRLPYVMDLVHEAITKKGRELSSAGSHLKSRE